MSAKIKNDMRPVVIEETFSANEYAKLENELKQARLLNEKLVQANNDQRSVIEKVKTFMLMDKLRELEALVKDQSKS